MTPSSKNKTNFVVDTIGYLAFLVLLSTGIIMKFILLPGRDRVAGDPSSLMGYGRHDWGEIHFWASIVFVSAIVIHLLLHWKWLIVTCRNYVQIKTAAGVVVALVIPILLAGTPLFGTRGFEEESGHGKDSRSVWFQTLGDGNSQNRQITSNMHIRGRTTLDEIETGTGIRPQEIISALGLTIEVTKDQRIGRLCSENGLEMEEVRETIYRLSVNQPTSPTAN